MRPVYSPGSKQATAGAVDVCSLSPESKTRESSCCDRLCWCATLQYTLRRSLRETRRWPGHLGPPSHNPPAKRANGIILNYRKQKPIKFPSDILPPVTCCFSSSLAVWAKARRASSPQQGRTHDKGRPKQQCDSSGPAPVVRK